MQMGAYNEELLPGLRKMTRVVYDEGMKIAIQICHASCQLSPHLIGKFIDVCLNNDVET
jgi:2,4-dienoyl-CoA reductase-like NADH-dependent reductase (Old Yellow Enzyme family)